MTEQERKEKKRERNRLNYLKNKEEIKRKNIEWQIINKNKIKKHKQEYYKNNKENIDFKHKEYRKENKEKVKKQRTKYRKENKDKINETQKKWDKNRKLINPLYKLKCDIRNNINSSLRRGGYNKKSHTYEILGCSYEFFLQHIESQWSLPHNLNENGQVWMNWDNYGKYNGKLYYGWDFDHIIPKSSAKTEKELLKLCHYSNLQPLCSHTNRDIKKHTLIHIFTV